MNAHLRINKNITLFFAAAVLYGCGKESPKEDFTARVNNSYLNSRELDSLTGLTDQYKSEIIRNWVNRELLFQEALKEGIIDSKEYRNIIENSKKELASSMFINSFMSKKIIEPEPAQLKKYYEDHRENFLLDSDSFLLNEITFNDLETGINFRNALIESNWKRVSAMFNNDSHRTGEEVNIVRKREEIHPGGLMRIVSELEPDEVSIVFNDENKTFYIVQLINKFPKGTIPPFDFIKGEAEKRYVIEQKKKALQDYLEELYSKNDIEIRTGKK